MSKKTDTERIEALEALTAKLCSRISACITCGRYTDGGECDIIPGHLKKKRNPLDHCSNFWMKRVK